MHKNNFIVKTVPMPPEVQAQFEALIMGYVRDEQDKLHNERLQKRLMQCGINIKKES